MINKTKGNMYEDIDITWNPIGGICQHQCAYCYCQLTWARMKDASLRFRESYLKDNLGRNQRIFVVSSTDMFASNVPDEWIEQVLNHISINYPDNTYLFQSKNPERFRSFQYSLSGLSLKNHLNSVLGTTIETNREYQISQAPNVDNRANAIRWFSNLGWDTQVTIEPIMDFDHKEMIELISWAKPRRVYIGADSKGHKLPEPESGKVRDLISGVKQFSEVTLKKNLGRLLLGGQNEGL